ncbi:MAG: adenylate/guanylate cyclase domain-containing protein, partial [Hamadaea sp.]|nr:adenylate/guanylate cyclase domain-containing protein [Hamadaea sp.]
AELGELDSADRDARRAYRDFAAANDLWGRGFALVVRGVIARELNELGHAADLLSDALEYGERVNHPLLLGMAGSIRGFISLEQGDPEGAERDARRVLTLTRAHGVLESAQVGPKALLGAAHLAAGRVREALDVLRPLAEAPYAPSMLFARRQAVALYARALLADGRPAEALEQARLAVGLRADDVRSRVSAERVLAACESAMGYPAASTSR